MNSRGTQQRGGMSNLAGENNSRRNIQEGPKDDDRKTIASGRDESQSLAQLMNGGGKKTKATRQVTEEQGR